MPANLLSARHVDTAKAKAKPYTLRDGGSLFLLVEPNGRRKWRYRYRIGGKPNIFAIGNYPQVTLEQARRARDAAAALVKQGIHPALDRQAHVDAQIDANESTFQAVAGRWIEFNKHWSPGYADQVARDLANDLFPKIGRLPVAEIKAAHLRPIIQLVAKRGAECTANNLRMWCSQIFSYAAAHGIAENDPTVFLKGLVRRPPVRHNPPLSQSQLPDFLHKLDQGAGTPSTDLALRLMLLTFVRTVELRKATWDEFDLDGATWTIPATRMKMRRPHLVPLSKQAVAALRELHRLPRPNDALFPNLRRPGEDVMSNTTINRALERMGYQGQFSGHGFRSTATTILGLLGYPDKRVDLQLAHSKKKRDASRAPYDHAKYIASRRIIMQDWADIIDDFRARSRFSEIAEKYGPMSERRRALLNVIEREDQ